MRTNIENLVLKTGSETVLIIGPVILLINAKELFSAALRFT